MPSIFIPALLEIWASELTVSCQNYKIYLKLLLMECSSGLGSNCD